MLAVRLGLAHNTGMHSVADQRESHSSDVECPGDWNKHEASSHPGDQLDSYSWIYPRAEDIV